MAFFAGELPWRQRLQVPGLVGHTEKLRFVRIIFDLDGPRRVGMRWPSLGAEEIICVACPEY